MSLMNPKNMQQVKGHFVDISGDSGWQIRRSTKMIFLWIVVSMDWFKGKSTGNHEFSH